MITYEQFINAIAFRKPIFYIAPDFEMLTINPDIYETEVNDKHEEFHTIGNVGGHYYNAFRCFQTEAEAKEFARKELNRLLEEYK